MSLSSSSSSSSSGYTPSSINHNTKTSNTNQSMQLKHTANGSTILRTTSSKNSLSGGKTKAGATTRKSTTSLDRTVTHPNSQVTSSSSSSKKNQITNTQNSSSTSSTSKNLSPSYRPLTSNDLSNQLSNNYPIHSLVEGSAEYRELKRLYVREQNLVEEWRKDYQILKRQHNDLKSSTIPRPTAEVLEWLRELFDLMDNNVFRGDGRTLNEIGTDLGVDITNLVSVAARTPQKSALKLFRVLYPTIGDRAECVSISKLPNEQLQNIYQYVRTLHPNLNFHLNDMKKAIATSIRSAKSELRKLELYRQQQLAILQNDENLNPEERDERIEDAIRDINAVLHATDAVSDEDNDEEGDDDDDQENEDEENDDGINHMMVDDELDEDDE